MKKLAKMALNKKESKNNEGEDEVSEQNPEHSNISGADDAEEDHKVSAKPFSKGKV